MDFTKVPDASIYRLALYHCFVGEMVRTGMTGRITSRQISAELGIKEETVRRDLSYIGGVGRPGAGYETPSLLDALTVFLGLYEDYPIVKVGTAQMLSALQLVFPAHAYGVRAVAYYSELPEDVGKAVDDVKIKHITDLPEIDPDIGASVALVACSPGWVQVVIDLLHEAGIRGVLLLTPAIRLDKPEGMVINQVRMPCDIKSLACRCQVVAKSVEGSAV